MRNNRKAGKKTGFLLVASVTFARGDGGKIPLTSRRRTMGTFVVFGEDRQGDCSAHYLREEALKKFRKTIFNLAENIPYYSTSYAGEYFGVPDRNQTYNAKYDDVPMILEMLFRAVHHPYGLNFIFA